MSSQSIPRKQGPFVQDQGVPLQDGPFAGHFADNGHALAPVKDVVKHSLHCIKSAAETPRLRSGLFGKTLVGSPGPHVPV